MKETIYDYLKTQFGDDQELLDSIYDEYKSSFAEKLSQLKDAIEKGEIHEAYVLSHTIKGNAATVGHENARAHALAIELGTKANDLDECKKHLPDLVADFNSLA